MQFTAAQWTVVCYTFAKNGRRRYGYAMLGVVGIVGKSPEGPEDTKMTLTVGCAQLNSTDDTAANLAAAERAIVQAAVQGARLVMLPEHFYFLGPEESKRRRAEELAQAGWLPRMSELAQSLGIYIHIGSFLERQQETIYNTAVVISPDGEVIAQYRKLHLFDVEIPGGMIYRESNVVSPGDAVVSFEVDGFVFGMATCYDLRFPELFRKLVDHDATVLLVPAAFTLQTGRDHWEVLLRARAIENLCWVAAAGQWGTAPPGQQLFGRSMIINPWGVVISQAADGVTTIIAELDLEKVRQIRTRFPVLQHRRRDLFH